MKKLMLWMTALAAAPVSLLNAQNLTGTWQGSLKAGPQELRIVIKISLSDDKLKAVFAGKSVVNMFEMTKLVSKHLS